MGNGTTAVLEPTFRGYVGSTTDALILFEACLNGILHHVPRRPHDRERGSLVRSGSVFIYEENASGIKRWTDGVTWSPSRILGNFLVYRELDKPFPPGEKKRAMKKNARRPPQPARPGEPYPRPQQQQGGGAPPPPPQSQHQPQPESNGATAYSPTTPSSAGGPPGPGMGAGGGAGGPHGERSQQSEIERALVGSLVDSYGFKEDGLVKKTMSVTVAGVTHHLVSYYSVEDVMRGILVTPSMVENLRHIRPRMELTTKQSFRAPIDDMDHGGMDDDPSQVALYGYRHPSFASQGYGMPPPPPAGPGYYAMPPGAAAYPPQQPQQLAAAAAHQQPQLTGYAVQPSGMPPPGAPVTAAQNPYMSAPTASTDMPPIKTDVSSADYSAFPRGQVSAPASAYPASGFDPMAQQQAMSTQMSPGISPATGRAPHPSQQPTSATAYRHPSFSSGGRSIDPSADPNVTAPPSAQPQYSRGSFSMAPGGMDGGGPQQQPPPPQLEHRGSVGHAGGPVGGFDPMNTRRDSAVSTASSYYTADNGRRPQQPPPPPHQPQQPSPPHQQQGLPPPAQQQQPPVTLAQQPTPAHPQHNNSHNHNHQPPPPAGPQRQHSHSSQATPPQPSPSQQHPPHGHYFAGAGAGPGVYPAAAQAPPMSTWNGAGAGAGQPGL